MKDNPYVGPRSIGGDDHPDEKLYGREREVHDLLDLLIADRVVLLYSPSGAGKTSILQAGLAPKLKQRGFQLRRIMRVNAAPPPGIDDKANRYVLSALLSLEERLEDAKKTPTADLARMTLAQYLGSDVHGEVLIFDQFEEILTVDPLDIEGKKQFFAQAGEALRHRGRWAVFSMREDYLAGIDRYVDLVPTRLSNTYHLGLLDLEDALGGVRGPARERNVEYADGVAEELVRNLSLVQAPGEDGRPRNRGEEDGVPGLYVEPVQLQVVCRRIWDKLDDGTNPITRDHIGGASGGTSKVNEALGEYYQKAVEDAAAASSIPERAIRRWVGRSLITRQKTRSQASISDDATVPVVPALKTLGDAYLIRSGKRYDGSTWFELAHDRLIGPVLANNLAKTPELLQRAELWDEQGRSEALLLNLTDARRLAPRKTAAAPGLEFAFADASWKRLKRQFIAMCVAAVMALCLAGVGVLGVVARRARRALEEANHQQFQIARRALSASLAETAAARADGRVDLAALLAIQAWRVRPSSESAYTLLGVLQSNLRATRMLHHDAVVNAMAVAPDVPGAPILATGCGDGTIWLWYSWNEPSKFQAHKGAVLSLSFNKDGLLASGGDDGQVLVWDLKTQPVAPAGNPHQGRVNTVVFDEGGDVLLSGGQDGIIRSWSVGKGRVGPGPVASTEDNGEIKSLAFRMADREAIYALSSFAIFWPFGRSTVNLDTRKPEAVGMAGPGTAQGIPSVPRKFAVDARGGVTVWEGKGTAKSALFGDFTKTGALWAADLDPDLGLLAAGGQARKVWIFDLAKPGEPLFDLGGPESPIRSLRFLRRKQAVLLSLSENDRSVWVWNVDRTPPRILEEEWVESSRPGDRKQDALQGFAMHPSGKWFVSSLEKGSRLLGMFRRAADGKKWQQRNQISFSVGFDWEGARRDRRMPLAVSPRDEQPFVVNAELDGSISIRSPELRIIGKIPPAPSKQPVLALAVNSTSTLLAVGGRAQEAEPGVRVYSLANPAQPALLHTISTVATPVEALAFHPSRDLLAAGGNSIFGDKMDAALSEMRLWDLSSPADPKLVAVMPRAEALRAVFSPDGKILATAGSVVALWDVPDAAPAGGAQRLYPRAVLSDMVGIPFHLRFSPDGKLLVTAESDAKSEHPGTNIHLWDPVRGVRFGPPLMYPDDWQVDVGDFEPDGKGLLLWSNEGILRLPLEQKQWAQKLCGRANRNLSQKEWDLYVGGKYEQTCLEFPKGEGVRNEK